MATTTRLHRPATGDLAGHAVATANDLLELFDRLPAVGVDELRGRYRGSEIPTGHPMDGVLTAAAWYGKQFDGPEAVHPLLFRAAGTVFPGGPASAARGRWSTTTCRSSTTSGPWTTTSCSGRWTSGAAEPYFFLLRRDTDG